MGMQVCTNDNRELVVHIDRVYQEVRSCGRLPKANGGWSSIEPVALAHDACQKLSALAHREVELIMGKRPDRRASCPVRIVEVGFAMGMSTLAMMRGVLGAGVALEHIEHTAIDPYAGSSWGYAGRLLMQRCGLQDAVTVIEEDSAVALPAMLSDGAAQSIDLIFIDGGHRFEEVFLDLTFASRLIAPGRLVIVDDIWMPSVCKAIRYFERNGLARVALDTQAGGSLALLRFVDAPSRDWDAFKDF